MLCKFKKSNRGSRWNLILFIEAKEIHTNYHTWASRLPFNFWLLGQAFLWLFLLLSTHVHFNVQAAVLQSRRIEVREWEGVHVLWPHFILRSSKMIKRSENSVIWLVDSWNQRDLIGYFYKSAWVDLFILGLALISIPGGNCRGFPQINSMYTACYSDLHRQLQVFYYNHKNFKPQRITSMCLSVSLLLFTYNTFDKTYWNFP